MRTIVIGLSCAALLAASCGKKDEGGASSPVIQQPDLGLVASGDFKNTAKSGREVGHKLKEASSNVSAVRFAKSNSPKNQENILETASVQSFLSGRDSGNWKPANKRDLNLSLAANSNCGDNLTFLNSVYTQTASGLKFAAQTLDSLEGQKLPQGITRGAASDKFAVNYTVDLSKVSISKSQENSNYNSSRSNQTSDVKLNGLALVGAGANDTTAVLSFGINGAGGDKTSSGSINGGFAISTDNTKKLLQLSTKADIKIQDNVEGKPVNSHASLISKLALQAGELPSIAFTFSGSSNLRPNIQDSEVTIDHSDNAEHALGATIKIEKLKNDDVSVTYALTIDHESKEAKVTLTTDANGQCVVKNDLTTAAL